MVCCKCNRSSKCRQCACVKAGRKCSDYLPCRVGTCCNLSDTSQVGATPALHLVPTETALSPGEDSSSSQHSPNISRAQVYPEWPLPALEEPNFTWGNLQGVELHQTMKETFDEVIHWRRNLFQVPSGSARKAFVAELAWLYQAYADGSSLESVALMACSVAPSSCYRSLVVPAKAKTT